MAMSNIPVAGGPTDELTPEEEADALRRQLAKKANPTIESGMAYTQPVPTAQPGAQYEVPAQPQATGAAGAAAQAAQAPSASADPFEATGGGVQLPNGDWVPRDHPRAAQAGGGGVLTGTGGGGTTTAPGQPSIPQTVRQTYLSLATQRRVPSRTDPEISVPADAYRANVERATRSAIADAAERNGPFATGAQAGESRMLTERGGIAAGTFEAELMTRELSERRNEIMQSLAALSGMMTEEQRLALQRELAQIDAQLNYAQLGQNQNQFADRLGFEIGDREAYYNDLALRRQLGI